MIRPNYGPSFYRRCGSSGLQLPLLSLGLWQNFGNNHAFASSRDLVRRAFELGVTHFDLANNYGPPPGESERVFGRILREDLRQSRDEIIIATKAGYDMWPGPYGKGGSRKHLLASVDQSLRRLGVDYVDIFYSHRPDPDTPLEETLGALDHMVRHGKALYIGLSNYNAEQTARAAGILRALGTPHVAHQPRYNMFERGIETELLPVLAQQRLGTVVFCPLAQGLLSGRYLAGVPSDSRAGQGSRFLTTDQITSEKLARLRRLNQIAERRGQSLAQLALVWVLRLPVITSALIGASKVSQLEENVAALEKSGLTDAELKEIDSILADPSPAV